MANVAEKFLSGYFCKNNYVKRSYSHRFHRLGLKIEDCKDSFYSILTNFFVITSSLLLYMQAIINPFGNVDVSRDNEPLPFVMVCRKSSRPSAEESVRYVPALGLTSWY